LAGAIELADQVLSLAEQEGNPTRIGLAYVGQVNSRHFSGDLLGAEDYFARGAPFFPAVRKAPGLSLIVYGFASHNAWMLGRADTARDRMKSELASAREVDSPFQLAFAQFVAAMLQLFLRDPEGAVALDEQSVNLSDQHGFPYIRVFSSIVLGRALASLRRAHEGVSLIRDGIGSLPGTDHNYMTRFLSCLAEAQALDGARDDALVTIEQALNVNSQERAWQGDLLRTRGELRLELRQTSAAETDFRHAIALAQKIGAKAWELRAVMSLVRMLRKRGDLAEARGLLVPLYSRFTEGFDTADLKDAKALIKELNG